MPFAQNVELSPQRLCNVQWRNVRRVVFWASVAIPIVVAVLPQTGWAVRNHLRAIGSALTRTERPDDSSYLTYPPLPDGPSRDRHLAHLLQATREDPEDLAELRRLASRVPIQPMLAAAYIAKVAELYPPPALESEVPPDQAIESLVWAAKRIAEGEPHWRDAVEVARAAEATDPDNAYFPATEARMYLFQLDLPSAEEAIDRACRCGAFRNFEAEMGDLVQREEVRAFGYRGVLASWDPGSLSWRLFHGLSWDYVAQAPQGRRKSECEVELARLALLMSRSAARQSELVIARVVGTGAMKRPWLGDRSWRYRNQRATSLDLIDFERRMRRDRVTLPPDLIRGVAELYLAADFAQFEEEQENDREDRSLWYRVTSPSNLNLITEDLPVIALTDLLGCLLLWPILFGLSRAKLPPIPLACFPGIVAGVWAIGASVNIESLPTDTSLHLIGLLELLLAAACASEKLRLLAFGLGCILPGIGLLLDPAAEFLEGDPIPYWITLSIVGGGAVMFYWHRRFGPGRLLVGPLLALGIGAMSFGLYGSSFGHGFTDLRATLQLLGSIVLPVGAVVLWQSVSIREAARQLARCVPFALGAFSILYGLATTYEVVLDARMREYIESDRTFAFRARSWVEREAKTLIP